MDADALAGRIDGVFADEAGVRQRVATYFATPEDGDGYLGRHLTTLFGGGAVPAVAYLVAPADLIAVQMLHVHTPPAVSHGLLEGDLGREISAHLRGLPIRASIFDPRADELLQDGGAADAGWRLLARSCPGGDAIAGALLARKRPALVPVLDDVVRCALGDQRPWLALHAVLADEARGWEVRLSDLRSAAGVSDRIPPLRVLEAAIWMSHSDDHGDGDCTPPA